MVETGTIQDGAEQEEEGKKPCLNPDDDADGLEGQFASMTFSPSPFVRSKPIESLGSD